MVFGSAFQRKTMIGPVIMEKAQCSYDGMKVTEKCTFFESGCII